jgi:hypothetical protein
MTDMRRIQVRELPFLTRFPELSGPAQRELDAALIRLHPQDGISVLFWVEKLKSQIAFKSCNDPPPEGSGLDQEAIILIIQCPYQQEMFDQLGNTFLGIDATYNTTQYEAVSLFTVLVQDRCGHGAEAAPYTAMLI